MLAVRGHWPRVQSPKSGTGVIYSDLPTAHTVGDPALAVRVLEVLGVRVLLRPRCWSFCCGANMVDTLTLNRVALYDPRPRNQPFSPSRRRPAAQTYVQTSSLPENARVSRVAVLGVVSL